MTRIAKPVGPEGRLSMTAAAAVTVGSIVQHPCGLIGIFDGNQDAKAGDKIGIALVDNEVIQVPANTVAMAAGDHLHWDDTAKEVVPAASVGDFANILLVEDSGAGVLTAKVLLNRHADGAAT